MTAADPTPDLAAAVTRLREHAEVCERHDTGDGWMETPIEAARQMGADLRVVLGVVDGLAETEALAFLDGIYAARQDTVEPEWAARWWRRRQANWTADAEDREIVGQMLDTTGGDS